LRGPVLTRLLTAAALAPSGHNTQPWRFSVEGERITILPDPSRRLPVVDPDDHALYISLGCAVENLVVAARGEGYHAEVDDTGLDGEDPALTVHLRPGGTSDGPGNGLPAAISQRQSTRRPYDGRAVPVADLGRLEAASRQEGVDSTSSPIREGSSPSSSWWRRAIVASSATPPSSTSSSGGSASTLARSGSARTG